MKISNGLNPIGFDKGEKTGEKEKDLVNPKVYRTCKLVRKVFHAFRSLIDCERNPIWQS